MRRSVITIKRIIILRFLHLFRVLKGEGISGVMQASVSTDTIENTIAELYTQGGVIIGIAMILLALAGVFAADRVVRPLHRITGAIESVTEGYTDDVLHVETFTETRQMSEAFNKMLGRLKLLDESREEFVSNVSHELKTPMTSMKVLADSLLEQENVPVEMYQEFMGILQKRLTEKIRLLQICSLLLKWIKQGRISIFSL